MLPKVSVLWLNYNSMHVMKTTKDSLQSLTRLDYPNFELVIVDNNSSDGSREAIEEYISNIDLKRLRIKFLKLDKNVGFAGGMNAAYGRFHRIEHSRSS